MDQNTSTVERALRVAETAAIGSAAELRWRHTRNLSRCSLSTVGAFHLCFCFAWSALTTAWQLCIASEFCLAFRK